MGCRFAVIVLAALLPGCASASWLKLGKESFPKADSSNPVVRILAVWQVGEGQNAEGMTTRGFVGQIFLLDAQKQVPVAAEGSVRIYLFDDQGTSEERDRPIHQHDFPVDSWRVRLQKTKMGPAYVLFTPYVRKGAHKAECSIRIKFTPADGGAPVYSDLAPITLPGKSNKPVDPIVKASPASPPPTSTPEITATSTASATPDKRTFSASSASLQEALEEARRGREAFDAIPVTPEERSRIEAEARTRWGDNQTSSKAPPRQPVVTGPPTPASPSTPSRHPLEDDADSDTDTVSSSRDDEIPRPAATLARPKTVSAPSTAGPATGTTPASAAISPRCHGNRSLALPDPSGTLLVNGNTL